LSRSVPSRVDALQLHSQVSPQEPGERRITDTVLPTYPGKESVQSRVLAPLSSRTIGPASPEARWPAAALHPGLGTRLNGRKVEKGIQLFVRPPVAQISPLQGTRLISGIADRGNAQEQKRGDATKLGLRRRFELGSQFMMSSQQENLGVEKRQNIPHILPSLLRLPEVTKIDVRVENTTKLRSSGISDAMKTGATSYKDVRQANLPENEVCGGSPSALSNDSSTEIKKSTSHYRDDLNPSNPSDSLTLNFQREAPVIPGGDNHHLVSASNTARNGIFENERVLSSHVDSRAKNTSGTVRSMAANPSTNHTSVARVNQTATTSLEYLSRSLSVAPNASGMNNNTASTIGGEPARQTRRTMDPFAKSGVSTDTSKSSRDIETQIDSVISGTSKRLREIQQDCGNGGIEHYSKKGGYDQGELGSGKVTSEGSGKKIPLEMDCNVPAFVAALERDSHSLASALCR
jgi:hypothetical protein